MTNRVLRESKDQTRWNRLGPKIIGEIEQAPDKQIVRSLHWLAGSNELLDVLSPMKGKKILELGCGWGRSSIFLARQGAKVTGVDIGPDLILAAQALAKANRVECDFQTADIVKLPFPDGSFDAVFGVTILHHLSQTDVDLALAETARVLRSWGKAVFIEPVENSRTFDFIQNLVPAGKKGDPWHRPSILQRKAWRQYTAARDNRVMTTKELLCGKRHFRSARISPYGFLVRLARLVSHREMLEKADTALFASCPLLGYLSQTVLVEYHC